MNGSSEDEDFWFGCKAFRQFVEGLLLRASTHGKGTFPKRLLFILY